MRRISVANLLIFMTLIIGSCTPKVEIIKPATELYVTVFQLQDDKENVELAEEGIEVFIFDRYEDYKYFIDSKYDTTDTDLYRSKAYTDSVGMAYFIVDDVNLDSMYIVARVERATSVSGLNIFHDNTEFGYKVLRPINRSSITETIIIMSPAESYVNFYAQGSQSSILPIKINFDENGIDTLNKAFAGLPTFNEFGTVFYKARRGTYSFFAINDLDCKTQENLTLGGGNFYSINVNQCNAGKVSFWTGIENKDVLPINVYINDDKNYLGTITNAMTTIPGSCKDAGQMTASLAPGVYTIFATVAGVAWQDKINVSENSCQTFQLKSRF